MVSLEDKVYLRHIIDAMNAVQRYCGQITEDEFYKNEIIYNATIRQIEVIGEATIQLSSTFKQQHTQIPWNKMANMRNRLIHGYFGIDLSTVWSTVQKNIPITKLMIEKLYHELEQKQF